MHLDNLCVDSILVYRYKIAIFLYHRYTPTTSVFGVLSKKSLLIQHRVGCVREFFNGIYINVGYYL